MAERNLALLILINAKDQASSVIQSIKSNILSFAGVATAALGAALFKGAIDDAVALDLQMRKLEQVIKATGDAAGVTAGDINKMFAGEGNAAQFRDAAAQLLTFKSVSKDVFETTLRLAEDLAVSGFGTLEGNAVQLGKALEDPVKGLTALTRSGVTFTQTEQNLIKQLVETGDKARAQGIILEAVAGQVGGVANAMEGGLAGAAEKVDASFRQMRENLGGALLPALTVLATFLGNLSAKWAGVTNSTNNAGQSTQAYSGSAIFLAKAIGQTVLFVDRLGRGLGAVGAKLVALSSGDFAGLKAIDEAFSADNAAALADYNKRLDELQKPRTVSVKTEVDTGGARSALDAVDADVETVINQFKIWDKESTDAVDNIAAELAKLSDVELQKLKNTLAEAFETGANRSNELKQALAQISTEEVTRAWKTLGQESSASLKQASDAARAAYNTIRDSGTASATDLENAWSAYIAKVLQAKSAISEVDAAEKQRKQNLADLDAIGSTGADQAELRRRELTQQTIDFEKALRQGDFAEAVRLGQEKEALALENARAEKQAFADGERSSGDAYLARQKYLRAIEDTKKALDELGQSEQQQTDAGQQPRQNKVAEQQAEAAKLQQTIELLKQPINLQINSNFAAQIGLIDQLQQKANALTATLSNGGATTATNDGQAAVSNGLGTEVLKRGARI